jgi:hypothetical protein
MRSNRYPWLLWALSLLLVVAAAWALIATGALDPGAEPVTPTQRWGELLMAAISATAGAVILSNRGNHPIGWIFMAFGLFGALQQLGISYAATCVGDPGACALGVLVILDGLWFVTVTLGLGGLFLLFPDGEVPKGRRWLAISLVAAGIGSLALAPFTPELYHIAGVANPWAIDAPQVMTTIDEAKGILVLLLAVTAIVDFVWRARKAEGLTRLQNRWLALAGLLTVLGGTLSVVGQEIGVDLGWAWSLGVASIPVAVTGLCLWPDRAIDPPGHRVTAGGGGIDPGCGRPVQPFAATSPGGGRSPFQPVPVRRRAGHGCVQREPSGRGRSRPRHRWMVGGGHRDHEAGNCGLLGEGPNVRRALLTLALVVSIGGILAGALGTALEGGDRLWPVVWLPWGIVGYLILLKRPGNGVGAAALTIGVLWGISFGMLTLSTVFPGQELAAWVELTNIVLGVLPWLAIIWLLLVFPSGTYESWWERGTAIVVLVMGLVMSSPSGSR